MSSSITPAPAATRANPEAAGQAAPSPAASLPAHDVVIIGAGTGGVSVAAALRRSDASLSIAVIEPSEAHYYQPAWTLVGGGQYEAARTRRDTAAVLPPRTTLVKGAVASVAADQQRVVLADGRSIQYKALVVAAGLTLDWAAIEGLEETLGRNGVTSNYHYAFAPYTWECVKGLGDGSVAIFTQPGTPIKCAGAPQKALYLAADACRRSGAKAKFSFYTATASIFGVPFYARALDQVMAGYDAQTVLNHELVAVNGADRIATFETKVDGEARRTQVRFDLLHVVPPQRPPAFIRQSALSNDAGWLDVDAATLQHTRHPAIFGLGDCTSTPNSKTAAAVKAQAPVAIANVLCYLGRAAHQGRYDGYAACPLTTSAGKVLLAEFSYGGVITPSLPLDPRKPRRSYWSLKKTWLPWFYWNLLLKGRSVPALHRQRKFDEGLPAIRA